MKRLFTCTLAAALLASSGAGGAFAYAGDKMIEGAKQCTRYLPKQEREYGIPLHLLAAIASTESGRYHKGLKMPLPWPWTINAEGRGQFFNTKQEAIAEVRKLLASGVRSIDVGCMQVNLHHHPDAFANLNEAFEPRTNVAYAAKFLKTNYDDLGSWKKAAAAYHSRTPEYGNKYIGLVFNTWKRIINEVRAAKVGKQAEIQNMALTSELSPNGKILPSVNYAKPKQVVRGGDNSAKRSIHKPIRMKMIELSKRDRSRENGVIVIRPQSENKATEPVPVRVASAEVPKVVTTQESPVAALEEGIETQAPKAAAPVKPAASAKQVQTAAAKESTGSKQTKTIRMEGEAPRRYAPTGNVSSTEHLSDRKTGPKFIFD